MVDTPHLTPAWPTLLKGGWQESELPNGVIKFILCNGWAAAPTRQYKAAVNKCIKFVSTLNSNDSLLPATAHQIYHFLPWCSTSTKTNVSSNTIKLYLTGLRMCHALHNFVFPLVNSHCICLLLKACTRPEEKRSDRTHIGLFLQDVLDLSHTLTTSNQADLVTEAIIMVGFWGLARLGELTLSPNHPLVFLRSKDVSFSKKVRSVRLRLRMAKTAANGDLQIQCLLAQPKRLDPVDILHEVLQKIPGAPDDPLFRGDTRSVPIDHLHVFQGKWPSRWRSMEWP